MSARPRPTATHLAWGAVLVAAYVAAAVITISGRWPAALLFDGFSPPAPYRWVAPPPGRGATNQPPEAARQLVKLAATGSFGLSVVTGDAQASLVAAHGAFPPAPGQRSVLVTISPADPVEVGEPPPGLVYNGNAYTFAATYQPSGDAAPVRIPVSVLLRYPTNATTVARRDGQRWSLLKSTPVPAGLQVFADTPQLGVFVAVAGKSGSKRNLLPFISGGAILLAAVAGLAVRRRQDHRRAAARVAATRQRPAKTARRRPTRGARGRRKRHR